MELGLVLNSSISVVYRLHVAQYGTLAAPAANVVEKNTTIPSSTTHEIQANGPEIGMKNIEYPISGISLR